MSNISRVLFPVDFSLGCESLVPTVRKMIELWHAEVTLLHVLEKSNRLERRQGWERPMMQMRMIARAGLRAPDVCCRVERGTPANRILEYVRANPQDLVVISAGVSSRLRGNPVGNVADRILQDAPCPVWLDWGSGHSQATAGMDARRVCCALELNDHAEHVLSQAAALAADFQAQLTLIHAVYPTVGKPLAYLWDQGVRERAVLLARSRIDALRRRLFPSAEVTIGIGSSQTVVGRTLQSLETGLLVTGNSREAILAAESECPVLRLVAPAAATAFAAVPQPRYAMAGHGNS